MGVRRIASRAGVIGRLFDHLLMVWTGIQRDAGVVLSEQQRNTASNRWEATVTLPSDMKVNRFMLPKAAA